MPLPTSKTPPKTDLASLTTLLYGKPKIGKSTFCSHADGAIFLATEAGLGSLDVYQLSIATWEDLTKAAGELADGKHQFKTVVIDTIDNAYKACVDYVCKRHKVDYVGDLEFGKGYALVANEFHRVLTKLSHLPYGLILVSHSIEREVETRTGKILKAAPTLPEKARQIVLGLVDVILFADNDAKTGARILRTKPAPNYEAGDRTGRLPEEIELSYPKFAEAFTVAKPAQTDAKPKTPKADKTAAAPTAQAAQ